MGTMDGVLLVSDFDDTLVDRKKHLPERTKAALAWFVSQGGLFTLASGRGLESVRLQAPGLPIGAPVSVANGTQIYDLSRENMLFGGISKLGGGNFRSRTALCGAAQ